jgi:RNA polymerase primary sigma factor
MKQLAIKNQITERQDQSFATYLREIARLPMLSADEEAALGLRAQQGDQKAIDLLVKGNLRFVVSVAKQYQHFGVPLNDLVGQGNIGLIKAAGKFDPTRGFKFISYAVWWIRQTITASISEYLRQIRLPSNCEAAIVEYNKTRDVLEQKLGREPSIDEVLDHIPVLIGQQGPNKEGNFKKSKFDLKRNKVELITTSYKPVSLDTPIKQESTFTLHDTLSNAEATNEMLTLDKDMERERLFDVLKTLSPLENKILTLRFGLDGEGQRSYDEIGIGVDLTGERIRQIQQKALRKLKKIKKIKTIFDAYLTI